MKKSKKKHISPQFMRRGFPLRRWLCMLIAGIILPCSLSAQHQKVSVKVQNEDISVLFRQIREQTQLNFVYDADQLTALSKITLNADQATVESILAKVFDGTPFEYRFDTQSIIIRRKPSASPEGTIRKIRGIVTDLTNHPLPGVTLVLEGTTLGTSTDAHGEFALNVPENTKGLLVTFIGMKSQHLDLEKGKEFYRIMLKEDSQEIDEVVVTGYQVVDRRKNTSAITTVRAEDIMRPGVTTIDQMLEGQIPDLISMTNSGEIGVAPKLRIRGTSTLIGNREPLWVIDGIIQQDPVNVSPEELNDPDYINHIGNAISGLNPQDIERIDVLKDASATALYGTKAANGVIVITTKRGHVGAPIVTYNLTGTFKLRPRYSDRNIDLMTSKERVQFSRELLSAGYQFPSGMSLVGYEYLYLQLHDKTITYDQFQKEVADMEMQNTDWFDILGEDSFSSQHTISVTGGSEKSRYYASIGYTDDNDVVRTNRNDRYTAALNLDINFTDALSASFDLSGNRSKKRYYQNEIAPIDYAYNTSRIIPLNNEDGSLYFYKKNHSAQYYYDYNILNELENSGNKQEASSYSMKANIRYSPLSWLKLNGIFSYSISNTELESYWGAKTFHAAGLRYGEYGQAIADPKKSTLPDGGELTQSNTRSEAWTFRLQLDINKYFGKEEQHNINASLGAEANSNTYKGTETINRGYDPERGLQFIVYNVGDYPAYDAWLTSNKPVITDNLTNTLSAYASLSYSYRNWITLNANARYDGSNWFGSQSNDKLLPVWSASLSYNPLEQFRILDFFDYLQLKFSYGYQGNMLDNQSPEVIIRKLPMDTYFNELTANVDIYPNPDLIWERTNSLNAGIEFSILKRLFMISSDFYYKKTEDAFLKKNISKVNGLDSYTVNGGEILNRGFNVSVTVSPVHTKHIRWILSTSVSKSYNRIESEPSTDQYDLENFLNGTVISKGEAVNTFFSYKFRGLSYLDGGPLFDDYAETPERLYGKSKQEIFTTILDASGSREPKLSGGINNTVNFWNFRLNMNFAYSLGAKTRLFKMYTGQTFTSDQNANRAFLRRWQRPGDEKYTDIPSILGYGQPGYVAYSGHWSGFTGGLIPELASSAWEMYNYSDLRVVSADYLKCTNLSLTYMFPEKLLSKCHLERLELSFSAGNPFILCSSKLKGQTPTQGGFTEIQLSERPTFSFGLNVSF